MKKKGVIYHIMCAICGQNFVVTEEEYKDVKKVTFPCPYCKESKFIVREKEE